MSLRQLAKRKSRAQEKARMILDTYWAGVDAEMLWNRKVNNGFTTIPRTMPLLMSVIDSLTKNTPAGQAYFALWCRSFDESLLVIDNPSALATDSGFSGERAVTTWKSRMRLLQELGFIDAREGSSGAYHYVLLWNPHKVLWSLKDRIQDRLFLQVLDRALDVGATDMSEGMAGSGSSRVKSVLNQNKTR